MTSLHYNKNKSYLWSQCTSIKNRSNTIKATYDHTIIKNNIQKAQQFFNDNNNNKVNINNIKNNQKKRK